MSPRPPGRPRSSTARRSIIKATLSLVNERGYGAATMEEIARRAGVSKQTVYRWWPSPAAIVLEAINEGASRAAPLPDSGDFDADLREFIRRSVDGAQRSGRLLTALMSEAQRNPDFAMSFRTEFLAHRRNILYELLDRARRRGAIRQDADLALAVEIFFGTLWYRLLADAGPVDSRFADSLTGALLALITPRQSP
ncbi:TetR/AcrR family transcriptional regulator [Jongsikchunia kroppenstedtii]|uniref:TetR/AcrR family transcriptional regulator n=1 Tax=Jongsikchunia kroppenstedtii TaxID=1121721 RepID=UPI000362341F|nr:TetR/AcrR family transcriptional regulator [Jongsikchunia kroppenstedtii]